MTHDPDEGTSSCKITQQCNPCVTSCMQFAKQRGKTFGTNILKGGQRLLVQEKETEKQRGSLKKVIKTCAHRVKGQKTKTETELHILSVGACNCLMLRWSKMSNTSIFQIACMTSHSICHVCHWFLQHFMLNQP